MTLDVPATTLVRAGGSALLAVVGVLALFLSRGNRGGIALGVTLTSFGVILVGNNLLRGNAAAGVWWNPIEVALTFTRGAGLVGMALWWPRPLRRDERGIATRSLAIGVIVFLLMFTAGFLPGQWEAFRAGRVVPTESNLLFQVTYFANTLGFVGIWASVAVLWPLRYAKSPRDWRVTRRQLAFGGTVLFISLDRGGDLLRDWDVLGVPGWTAPTGAVIVLAGVAAWLYALRHEDARPARLAAHATLGVMLAGTALEAVYPDGPYGYFDAAVGIERSVLAFLLAYGMLRMGFLGHDVQIRTARRGTTGMAALASLFVVAQVAQEFLSAQYGLLMGGLVAGTLLFAAAPIQRAVERLGGDPTAPAHGQGPTALGREDLYRRQLALALRDRKVTREEELTLAELADALGIPARRALEIRHEIEGER
ncbi:MAG: hypothetical protein ACT4PT_03980 [Methanobacteriota archaeon]